MSDVEPRHATQVSPKTFWRLIGQRAVGATIVTARDDRGPAGFLGLSASHVCADPPTMLVSVDQRTSALSTIIAAGHFAINYLPGGRAELVDVFGGKSGLSGADRFDPVLWSTLSTGAPTLNEAVGAMDCRVTEIIERHSVSVIFGHVVDGVFTDGIEPLILFHGQPL